MRTHGIIGSLSKSSGEARRPTEVFLLPVDQSESLQWAAPLLSLVYWYTRRTSAGISHVAVWTKLAPIVIDGVAWNMIWAGSWIHTIFMDAFTVLTAVCPWLLEFRAISPWVLDGNRWKDTILRHRIWTHLERASMRQDMPTGQAMLVSIAVQHSLMPDRHSKHSHVLGFGRGQYPLLCVFPCLEH